MTFIHTAFATINYGLLIYNLIILIISLITYFNNLVIHGFVYMHHHKILFNDQISKLIHKGHIPTSRLKLDAMSNVGFPLALQF